MNVGPVPHVALYTYMYIFTYMYIHYLEFLINEGNSGLLLFRDLSMWLGVTSWSERVSQSVRLREGGKEGERGNVTNPDKGEMVFGDYTHPTLTSKGCCNNCTGYSVIIFLQPSLIK